MQTASITAVIVDDEKPARALLRSLIARVNPDVVIAGEAEDVDSAIELLGRVKPDLLFLDVNLSPGSGFDILSQYKHAGTEVIFITAYDEYAVRAIRASALDYLVKPVAPDELAQAIARCAALSNSPDQRMEVFRENLTARDKWMSRIVLPTSRGFKIVPVAEILLCEADRSYTIFYFTDGQKLVCSKPLRNYDEILSGQGFFRVHQSWLVNLEHVVEFERRKKGGNLIMKGKLEVPVSETAKKELQDLFGA